MDLGPPASYVLLEEGTGVFSAEGEEIGWVAQVLASQEEDIFDGLVVRTGHGPGRRRFVEAAQVEEVFERGVVLKLDAAACATLPEHDRRG